MGDIGEKGRKYSVTPHPRVGVKKQSAKPSKKSSTEKSPSKPVKKKLVRGKDGKFMAK